MTKMTPTIYVKGGNPYIKDEFQKGKLVKLENASYAFLVKHGYILTKGQPCNIFFKSRFDDGGFVTSDITGEPVNVHSRVQEKELMKRNSLVHGDKNSKAKNRLSKKGNNLPGMQPVDMSKQHRAVQAHFEARKEHRSTYVNSVFKRYAKAKVTDF